MNLDKLQYTADPADAHFLARRHILAIDDDPRNRELITEYLGQNDLRITAVPDGPAMRSALDEVVVDLVLLDLKRKTEDGMSLVKQLRDLSAIPVIILTDRADEADKVMGLDADDYMTKPFSLRELLARIRAVLRRQGIAMRVRLSVQDSGVGFAPQDAEKLFEPFYTTKSDGMGIDRSIRQSLHHREPPWPSMGSAE